MNLSASIVHSSCHNTGKPIYNIPDFSTLPLIGTANVNSVNIPAFINVDRIDDDQGNEFWTSLVPGTPNNYFAATFTGFVKITTAGEYLLCLLSDDGSSLSVDGVAVVQNLNFFSYNRQCGKTHLLAGVHSVLVSYFQIAEEAGVLLTYSGPDTSNIEVVLQCPSAVSTFPSSIFLLQQQPQSIGVCPDFTRTVTRSGARDAWLSPIGQRDPVL